MILEDSWRTFAVVVGIPLWQGIERATWESLASGRNETAFEKGNKADWHASNQNKAV